MSRDLDEKFVLLRRSKVRGETHYNKQEKVDVNKYTTRSEQSNFRQFFEEGSWTELWAFVAKYKLKFKKGVHDEDVVCKYVTNRWRHYSISRDDKGDLGVETLDQEPGTKRFRRGVEDKATKEAKRAHADEEEQLDELETLQGLMELGRVVCDEDCVALPTSFLYLDSHRSCVVGGGEL